MIFVRVLGPILFKCITIWYYFFANPHWFVKYVKSCNAEEFDQRKINYGNMYGKVQLHSIVTKYQSKTSQNHKNTHKCVNFSLYNAQWCNIHSCKGHTILSLQVHIYAKSRKLYFTTYLCNEPSSSIYRLIYEY